MAEEVWRGRLRQRVASADEYVRRAGLVLELADAIFHSPLLEAATQDPVARASADRIKLVLSLESLKEVTQSLYSAIVYMQAARVLALIGGRVEQAEPLPEGAMGRLQTACTAALGAYEAIDCCRGNLSTAIALLVDGTGILHAGVLVEQERQIVTGHLRYAMGRHNVAQDQVAGALQMLLTPP